MRKNLFLLIGFVCLYVTALCTTPLYLLQPNNQSIDINNNQTFSWVTNHQLNNYELKIYECDYEESTISNSINLGDYELIGEKKISSSMNAAGLTWTEGSLEPLVICGDEVFEINAYTTSFLRKTLNWLFSFKASTYVNYKGITHLYNNHYGLIDEASGRLMYFDFSDQMYSNIRYSLVPKYELNINISNEKQGIEGIAYNQYNNMLYVAKEKSPMQLFEFKAATGPNFTSGQSNLTQPFNLENAAKNWGIKNVSGLFHLSKSKDLNGIEASNNLLVLSSESKVLIECDLNGNEISRLNLNANGANGTLINAIASAQGVSFGNGFVYILSSPVPEQNIPTKFYSFINKNYKKNKIVLGEKVFTKSNIKTGSYTVNNLNVKNDRTYCWNIESQNAEGKKVNSKNFSFRENAGPDVVNEVEKIITLKSPISSAVYRPGDVININWDQNIDFKVHVYLYKGSLIYRSPALSFSGRNVQYVIPTSASGGENYSVKVVSSNDQSVYASTNITIDNSSLMPAGPEGINITSSFLSRSYYSGSILPIRWKFDSSEKVIIKLKNTNGEEYKIGGELNNSGFFDLKIPFTIKSGTYYVEITSASNNNTFDKSDNFTIIYKPAISNVKLSNGYLGNTARYMPGDKITLTWDDEIDGDVVIQLFNGLKWVSGFTGVTKSDGHEEITLKAHLPIVHAINYRIRIISKDNNKIYAYSKAFKITRTKAFEFISPIKDTYNPKNMLVVRWKQLLNISEARVKIMLLKKGEIVQEIQTNTSNDGLFYWFPNVEDGHLYSIYAVGVANEGLVGVSPYFSFIGGQAKLMQQPDFLVAPNPATNFINISFKNTLDSDVYLKLYSTNGVCLEDLKVDSENLQLDVSSLPPGYYILNMKNNEHSVNRKILIE